MSELFNVNFNVNFKIFFKDNSIVRQLVNDKNFDSIKMPHGMCVEKSYY
jgi:hypothetical protein